MCVLLAALVLASGLSAFLSIVLADVGDYENSRLPSILDGAFIVLGIASVLVAMVVLVWGAR